MAENIVKGIEKVMQELDINKFVADVGSWDQLMDKRYLKIRIVKNRYALGISILLYESTKSAICSLLIEDSIDINYNIKLHMMNDQFWQNLKLICDFFEPFIKFIHELEEDVPLLSSAFFKLWQLEMIVHNNTCIPNSAIVESIKLVEQWWNDFLYNLATMAVYKLDPRYCGEILDPQKWDAPIEREIICLAGPENEEQNLVKARYPVLSEIALKLLSILATSAASEQNWSTFNFVHTKLYNRLLNPRHLIEDNANSQKTIEKESIQENDLEIDELIEESSFSQEYNLSNMNDIDYVDINDMEIYHVDNMDSSGNMDDTEYFKCQHPSSYSFLNYLRYNINDHQQWNKRIAIFTRYCNGLKLCSEDPDISDELKQRWKELINSQEKKDTEVVKSLWASIFSNAGGLDFYNLMKKIDNELEINQINLQDYADKLAFNHPLISGIIDLDIIDKVILKIFSSNELKEMMRCNKIFSWKVIDKNMKKWVDNLVKTEKLQNIPIPDSLYHEKCTYILDMYSQLGTRTPEEGNGRVERNYDEMFFKMSKNAKKMYQDKFQFRNKPDWLGTFKIDDHKYEFIYSEAAGPPFLSASFKSEGDRRKVIRFLLRCIESMDKTLKEHFSSPID
ncbi:42942_t:CDS:2, partial [Gigaspora margarita]